MGSYQSLMEQIRNKNLERVYLLHGKQAFVLKRMENNLIQAFLGDEDKMLNVHRLKESASVQEIDEACQAFPFFGGKQVVIAPESPVFQEQSNKGSVDEKRWKLLMNEVPAHTLLLFTLRTKADGRKAMTKAIPDSASILIDTMEEKDMKVFVSASFRARGVDFSPQALDLLVESASGDMGTMMNEAKKAEAHAYPAKSVDIENVRAVSASSIEMDSFMIVSDMLEGKQQQAMDRLRRFLQDGGRIEMLRGAIAFVLRDLITARQMLDRKQSAVSIRGKLRGRTADREAKLQMARKMSIKQTEDALCKLAQSDLLVRTSRTDEVLALETTLLKIFR